ncbi:hypothetical protein DND47_22650 [Pseudomonas syringae pv. syringae]|nr:hypothetical protein DND47_22650 [Pseudomonas syringae pv. syringae]
MPTPCGHERCSCGHLSFLTLQHGSAVHDAPRRKRTQSVQKGMRRRASHDSCDNRSSRSSVGMPFTTLRVARGRRASRKACDAERRTIVAIIVPHAPAWECRS